MVRILRVGSIFFSVIFWILFAEFVARMALRSDLVFSRLANNDDASWRLAWVKNYTKSAPFEFSFDMFDPLLGWRTKPNIANGLTGTARLTTNAKGIRALKDYTYDKPAGTTRILLLGDSFTFGEEVSDEEVYANLLEHTLPNTEVINTAVHGYGTDQMLLSLQQEGVKYHPDIVILGFIGEDMDRNVLSFRDFAKPKYEIVNGKLTLAHVPIPSPMTWIKNEYYRLKLFDIYEMLLNKKKSANGEVKQASERITVALLDEMVQIIRSIGATPVFVYLPTAREMDGSPTQHPSQAQFLLDYCKRKDVLCTNATSAFIEAREQGRTLKPGHWDAYEHSLVADVLVKYLKGKNLIP
ncbi:SGNH/GDSL hydrolase family protein [Candidatus Gottesmanbacteria bacterium]|nr:SGNH/GDSL hydrolase family protein [Candidatus Gottesmanbacteria bacterium]